MKRCNCAHFSVDYAAASEQHDSVGGGGVEVRLAWFDLGRCAPVRPAA